MEKLIKVLLIDDDPHSNYIAASILKNLKITKDIKIALNGHEGLDYILQKPESGVFNSPELIILDRKMPVMDAEEFIEALNNLAFVNRKDMVILLLSSTLSVPNIERFKRLGVEEFALKPLTFERVTELYNKYFNVSEGTMAL